MVTAAAGCSENSAGSIAATEDAVSSPAADKTRPECAFEYEYDPELGGIVLGKYRGIETNVELPSEIDGLPVKAIGDYTFSWFEGLFGVTISEGITYIGESAFLGCCELKSVSIPEGVTRIGENAFGCCYDLENISLPFSLTYIGGGAFDSCYALKSITIPDSVEELGRYAFNGCYALTLIELSDGLTALGENAFRGCSEELVISFKGEEYSAEEFYKLF